jgi:erythromycin esterase-like protein
MHGEEEFSWLRNDVFWQLVEREHYRSIAIESDCLLALLVDAYVARGEGSLDQVMDTGFSHGFGELGSNRELVWSMREYNRDRGANDRVRFYGFDAPTEMSGAASPRQALTDLYQLLAGHIGAASLPCSLETIDQLIGDDSRWVNPAAAMDPAQSIGASDAAKELRLVTDDLRAVLTSESPQLIAAVSLEEWLRGSLLGRTAAGLLRYHAAMADTSDSRVARMLAQRGAMMATNLQAILTREAPRGPTLAFGHNQHLRKDQSRWQLGSLALAWWSAGAIVGAQRGTQYAFLASALGSAVDQGLGVPGPDTLEGFLSTTPAIRSVFNSRSLAAAVRGMGSKLTLRTEGSINSGYFAVDPGQLSATDGIVFIKDIPSRSQ